MYEALILAVLIIGGVLVALTLLILANKGWREAGQAYERVRRRTLEPLVLAYAHGKEPSLPTFIGGPTRWFDRRVLEVILLENIQLVRGIEHDRLARALEELGFVEQHLDGLNSRRWWRRADAAEKLGLAGARRALGLLARALRDEVPEVRMRAAKALGLLGGTASARQLIHALGTPDRWSTIRIADILIGMGRQVVDELILAFPELTRQGKLAALDIVARVRSVQVTPWLVQQLRDSDADVRARGCHALGCIGDPEAGPGLIAALADETWPVRAMAAKSLGRMRHAKGIDALASALGDSEWWVRSNAAHALKAMGHDGAVVLEGVLEGHDRFARQQAVLMLQELGVVDSRVHQLAHPDPRRRAEAILFVNRLVDAGQTGRLQQLAREHPNLGVRLTLETLLPDGLAREEAA
jgi:HEAT repeat protein